MSTTSAEPGEPSDGATPDATPAALDDVVRPGALKIALRILIMVIGLAVAAIALAFAFDDFDLSEVIDAARGLDDAETIALIGGTGVIVWAEALLAASIVPGMPARRGALAYLGPNAVASLIPGPSDMPVRYRMFTSWGYDSSVAGTAVTGNALLNIGLKLFLPAVAGLTIAVADIPLEGVASTIITGAVVLALLIAAAAFILGSARRTEAFGRVLDRIWMVTMRLLRRETDGPQLADRIVSQRRRSLEVLHGRWTRAISSLVLVTVVRVSLLVMCLRFVGIPESTLSWPAIFCVWAIVRGLTVIPIMPGNVGIEELAYVGMLTPIAGSEYVNQVTAGMLIFRVLTWLLLIPTGGIALALWRRGLRDTTHDAAGQPSTTRPSTN